MDEVTRSVVVSDLDDAAADVDWVRNGIDSAGAEKLRKDRRYRGMVQERLRSAGESIAHVRRALLAEDER